jgi:DNA-binding transcriptional MerR regulator
VAGKSAEAFRTISEVAELIGTPAHVLRFWESKFGQIRPVKRAGGRRYYRPAEVALIDGIRRLLHDDGMTIRGVQKILREQGPRHVAALSRHAEGIEAAEAEPAPPAPAPSPAVAAPAPAAAAPPRRPRPAPDPVPEMPELPFGDLPRAEPPRPVAHVPPARSLPVSALLRRIAPGAAPRAALAPLEARLSALAERLSATPPRG